MTEEKGIIMAKPIKPTPMLCGAAATAFEKKIKEGLKKPSRPVTVKNVASIKEKAFALGKADS